MRRLLVWLVFSCTCIVFCLASPARRQYVSYTETSSDPSVVVTKDGESWDDSDDDFDLEGDGWLKEVSASPPSALPYSVDYEDYDGEEDSEVAPPNVEENNNSKQDSEFLFLSPKDTRLVLEDDDDDQSGIIKVRHTSKNSLTEPREDTANFIEDGDPNQQFVFTIDEDEDDDNNKIDSEDKDDDFVLDDTDKKPDAKANTVPRREARDDDDDDNDDDDDDNQVDSDNGDDSVFDSPEEDAQVIYGDHVFLY